MPVRAVLHLVDGRTISAARLDELVGWLSPGEAQRHARFVRAERQRQFVIGRMLARTMLGELLGVTPQALLIEDRPGQAPVLNGHPHISFSISHSGPWVACAVSADCALGLDIEQLDAGRDVTALAAQSFDAERCAWLAALPEASRLRDFYMLWSTQEARIKLNAEPASTLELPHPVLSIVLCSARPMSMPDLTYSVVSG
jgi:4'-phosphopantetheinyl transferase